ncbi:uncharacterized protein RB166_016089 [Leptodactylus fuscus]|uniref:uncharacterized protein LOC142216758 n=1 Tax=Leptodactylus fuscus TaxID=238119 RepID=UPI003F4E4F31
MDDAERRRKIRDFTFDRCKRGNQGFERILLQLFGYVGHAKSSFINTVKCVWSNSEYKNYANAGDDDGSRTTARVTYPLTDNIVLVDNRGCGKMNAYETGEIFAQLANLLPLDISVGWTTGFELADRIVEAEPYVKASDFIIPIFVYRVTNLPTPELKEELREIFQTATKLTKVVPIVVLTQRNHWNFIEAETMFRDIGAEKIFDLENYTDKSPHRVMETHKKVIQFLHEVIHYAEFQANYPRDADEEMIARKQFVLKYIHNRELIAQRENLDRLRDMEKTKSEQAFRWRLKELEKEIEMSRKLHQERMEKLQQDYERLRLQDQYEHEQRMKKPKNGKTKWKSLKRSLTIKKKPKE